MEKTICITVKDKIAQRSNDVTYTCGNSDYNIAFDFDDEWSEYETKTALFVYNGQKTPVVFTGNTCAVPIISNVYQIKVGVFAGNLHTTTPAIVYARKSILCEGGTPADPPDDVYNQIMERLNEIGTPSPEAIAAAVADYISANPIEEKDPTVPAWAKTEKKPEYTAKEVGAIDETELQTAINTALAQAKESGEFDGADGNDGTDGKDGVSCTHSWDGTVLSVTSASGTSSADLKGDKGDTGDTGPAGEKGDKGDTGDAGADGKSAYAYAVEGGYTGMEAEFAAKLAAGALFVTVTDNNGTLTADKNYYEILMAIVAGTTVIVEYYEMWFAFIAFTGSLIFGAIQAANYDDLTAISTILVEITPDNKVNDLSAQIEKLPNPNALTFTGAATGSYDGSEALTVEVPSGGGDTPLRLIKTVTLEETVKTITINTDNDGNAFSLSEIYIQTNATNSEDQTVATAFSLKINGKNTHMIGTTACMNVPCGKTGETGRNWIWLMSLNPLLALHGVWLTTNTASGKTVQCYQANEFNDITPNPHSVGEKITSIAIYGSLSTSYFSAGSIFRIYGR